MIEKISSNNDGPQEHADDQIRSAYLEDQLDKAKKAGENFQLRDVKYEKQEVPEPVSDPVLDALEKDLDIAIDLGQRAGRSRDADNIKEIRRKIEARKAEIASSNQIH